MRSSLIGSGLTERRCANWADPVYNKAGPLAEQSCGEFTPAVPATRTRHAPFQADAKPPEIRHRSFFRLQSLQPGTTPLLTRQFQAQPRRRTRRVASARGGLIPCRRWRTQSLRLSSDSAVRGLGLEQTVELGSPLGAQQGLDQGVRSLLCATARRTDKSYDSVGCWKDEPLGAQPLTCEAKENLRSLVLKGPFEPAKLRVLPSPVTGASRSRGVPEPRCSAVGASARVERRIESRPG